MKSISTFFKRLFTDPLEQRIQDLLDRLPVTALDPNFVLVVCDAFTDYGELQKFIAARGRDYTRQEILVFARRHMTYLDRNGVRMKIEMSESTGKPPIVMFGGSYAGPDSYGQYYEKSYGTVSVLRVGSDVFKACCARSTQVVDLSEERFGD